MNKARKEILIEAQDYANQHKITYKTVLQMVKDGRIKSEKIGSKRYIKKCFISHSYIMKAQKILDDLVSRRPYHNDVLAFIKDDLDDHINVYYEWIDKPSEAVKEDVHRFITWALLTLPHGLYPNYNGFQFRNTDDVMKWWIPIRTNEIHVIKGVQQPVIPYRTILEIEDISLVKASDEECGENMENIVESFYRRFNIPPCLVEDLEVKNNE